MITKIISEVKEGIFRILPDMTFNFEKRMIYVGVEFDRQVYPCEVSFDQVFSDIAPEVKKSMGEIIIKAKRIAANNGMPWDTPVLDSEIEDLL